MTSTVFGQKRVPGFHQVSKREKTLKPRDRSPSGFIVFQHWKPDETQSKSF